jgi:hypothetical protein
MYEVWLLCVQDTLYFMGHPEIVSVDRVPKRFESERGLLRVWPVKIL